MKYKIVSDSTSDLLKLEDVPFSSVPLHIIVGGEDFTDDEKVDLARMEQALSDCKSSSTACPGTGDWLSAFGDAEAVFCVTITSALSGSYDSARLAKQDYEERYPTRHVYIIDSLSTGPEMALIIEKLRELILSGMDERLIYREVQSYTQRTHLLFSLESLSNLAKNGRVSHTAAKLAGILGIRVVGKASPEGKLQLVKKCRGEQCSISCLIKNMEECGYSGGKVRIDHNNNEDAANRLAARLKETFNITDIRIGSTRALCSYYAEKGGLLVGFEG